jgi:hypothetical protein
VLAAAPRYDGFHGISLALLVAAIVVAAIWLVIAAVLWWRDVDDPDPGPETLELGDEPPAVVDLLVSDWRVTGEAAPATLADLAARHVIGLDEVAPEHYVVRPRRATDDAVLTPYEQQVARLVEQRSVGGSAPVEALQIDTDDRNAWTARFNRAVIEDAVARGLAARGWRRAEAVGLGLGLAATLALAAGALELAHVTLSAHDSNGGSWFVVAAGIWIVVLGAGSRLRTARPTPHGRAVCARWLGVREALRHQEGFADIPAPAVVVRGRLLAYGIALGVARAAAAGVPIGVADPEWTWSRESGSWRRLRVRYPKRFGTGEPPRSVLIGGIARVVFFGVIGFVVLPIVVRAVWAAIGGTEDVTSSARPLVLGLFVLIPAVLGLQIGVRFVDGAVRTWRAGWDLGHRTVTDGRVVKVHSGHFAVDDGRSSRLVALPIGPMAMPPLGGRVRVTYTPELHHVLSVDPLDSATTTDGHAS